LSLLRLSPRVFISSSPNNCHLLSLEINDFLFPPNQQMKSIKYWGFPKFKSYSWQLMIILQTFFIDLMTFVRAFTPPSSLFELDLTLSPLFYWKLSSIFKIIASVLFANCEPRAPLFRFFSYLIYYGNILKNLLPIISIHNLLEGKVRVNSSSYLFWLIFWHHLSLFIPNSRQKGGLLNLKIFFGVWFLNI